MISKLKRKFIIINMSLVSLVLIIVFIAIAFTSYDRVKSESIFVMERVLSREMTAQPPVLEMGGKRPEKHGPLIPVFSVLLDQKNSIVRINKENVNVSESFVTKMTKTVLLSGQDAGVFWQDQLRYMVRITPEGTKIAFADTSREFETLMNMFFVFILVGVGAIAAFYVISVYLSHWVIKPVEQAWEQQKRFVADASHELRTPLSVILANTGILLSHTEDPISKQLKWIEHTQTEGLRMKKLVDDLLFLAKADSEHQPTMTSTVNFTDALWSCLLPFESVAYENGVTIDTKIQPDLMRLGHEGQLKQLAVILIDNACKYTGAGGHVTVKLFQNKEDIIFTVNNTGSLIPKEDLTHIFDRFYRVDSARTREQGGHGLGLSIAFSIVEAHSGTISARSSKEEGTTFEVRL